MTVINHHRTVEIDAESITSVIRRLLRIANVLENRQFVSWYEHNNGRFSWCNVAVHQYLREKLMEQFVSLVDHKRSSELTSSDLARVLPGRLRLVADELSSKHDIKVPKGLTSLSVPRGASVAETIIEELVHDDWIITLAQLKADFYVREVLSELAQYARARLTLHKSTGQAWFEKVLEDLSPNYLLSGWMKDILSIDAHAVRSGLNITGMAMHKQYCSTWLYYDGEPIQPLHRTGPYVVHQPRKAA